MSKALDIRKEAVTRITAGDFADTIIRGKRNFNEHELPAVCIYMSDISVRSAQSNRYAMDAKLVIEYHKSVAELTPDQIDNLADSMLAQVRGAIEVDPRQFPSQILNYPGISYESDDIEYPEAGGNVVAVLVVYQVPHIENHG